MKLALAICLCLGLVLAGCGGSGSQDALIANAHGPGPAVTLPGGSPPEQLVVKNLRPGSGPPAKVGDEATVRYVGAHWKGGLYSNSWTDKTPQGFILGAHELTMPGLDQGIRGMRVGGRREIILPPSARYGSGSTYSGSAADETLVYVVDLLGLSPRFRSLQILRRKNCLLSHGTNCPPFPRRH